MLTTVRQALHLMGDRLRHRLWLLLLMALGVSLMEVLAAAMIYLLLAVVSNPDGQIVLPLIGDVRALAGGLDDRALLLRLIGVMLAFFVVRAAALVGSEYVINRMIQNSAARLSTKLVRGYLGMPFAFHLQRNSAELIRNSQQVTLELANSATSPIIRMGSEALLVMGILVLLVLVSPLATALAVVFVGGTSTLLLFLLQPRLKRLGLTAHAMHKETLVSLQQSFSGVRDIKLLGREKFFADAYTVGRRRLARTAYLRGAVGNLSPVAMDLALVGFILVFFAITVARGGADQNLVATLGLFGYAGMRLQPSLKVITGGLNSLKFAAAPAADVSRDMGLIEAESKRLAPAGDFCFEREVALEGVSFRYEGTECDALSGVDLVIKRGEQIGFCGPTGGGKSTLVDLFLGLLTPAEGRVTVDGKDINVNTAGWQRNLGVVPQTVFLVDDTVGHNIAFGLPEDQIDREALEAAVRLAQLEEFVASLPKGLETIVGERGVRVSGGERQRIAIARALYRRPQVLVFDEGTSALDNTTEHDFMVSLRGLRGTHTLLLVAHRLSTVRECDRVVFVEGGRIADIGTFEELKKSNKSFREMAGSN